MPLLFKAKKFKSILDGSWKYAPILVKFKKRVTTRQIAKEMSYGTTIAEGDLYHVLVSLPHYVFPHLFNSQSVNLEGLGTFTIVSKSKGNGGADTPEEVSADQISYLRVQFTPEYTMTKGVGKTRNHFENISFERWAGDLVEKSSTAGGDDSGGGSGTGGDDDWQDPDA